MPGSDNSLLPLSGIGPGSGRYGASERDFWLGPGSGWVIHNWRHNMGRLRGWHPLWSIQRGLRSNSGGGSETMDVSILRNKLTLELMSHAMAAICFNLYPNGVNSSHLTTLNGSLPPTLFPSVNIYRYSDSAALLCREWRWLSKNLENPLLKSMIFLLEHNLGKLDTKASDRVIISVICLQNAENVTRNGSVTLSSRDWDVAGCDVSPSYSRHVCSVSRWARPGSRGSSI